MQAAVFLDRDNTVIYNDGDLGDPADVRLIQGAASAIASLQGLGYKIVVVTNQGGVARGKYGEAEVQAVHARINEVVKQTSGGAIDRFYYCPYHPEGTVEQYKREHPWRKPQPGMLTQAAQDMQIDMAQSWMVGDQLRDIEAGRSAGVRTVLLREDAEELTPRRIEELGNAQVEMSDDPKAGPHFSARSLIEAVRIIAQQRNPDAAERNKRGQLEEARRRRDVTDRFRPDNAEGGGATRSEGTGSRSRAAVHGPAPDRRAVSPPRPAAAEAPAEPPPTTPASPKTSPEKTASPSQAEAAASPADVTPSQEKSATPDPAPAPQPAAPPQPPAPVVPPASADTTTGSQTTLRQILQELRNQRTETDDFSYLRVVAIVLQLIAAVCLLGGLWLGSEQIDTFHRWAGAAICLQLAVIASLLFDR